MGSTFFHLFNIPRLNSLKQWSGVYIQFPPIPWLFECACLNNHALNAIGCAKVTPLLWLMNFGQCKANMRDLSSQTGRGACILQWWSYSRRLLVLLNVGYWRYMVGLVNITSKRTLQGMYMDQIANAFIFPFIPVGECEPPTHSSTCSKKKCYSH